MNKFRRSMPADLLKKLEREPLFFDHLKNDKDIFAVPRHEYFCFYYKGGKLFEYHENGFRSHKKYLSVIDDKKTYLSQDELSRVKLIKDFISGYKSIKNNCEMYAAGSEAANVSVIYSSHSYTKLDNNLVVLDIEASFSAEIRGSDDNKKQDRIDLVLFNKKEGEIKFVEAKLFSNKEIWSEEKKKPKVVDQIKRYEEQLNKRRSEILEAYKEHVEILNTLFHVKLPDPKEINEKVTLLIFNYDSYQEKKIKELLINDGSLEGIKHKPIGNVKGLKLETLW